MLCVLVCCTSDLLKQLICCYLEDPVSPELRRTLRWTLNETTIDLAAFEFTP